MCWVHCSDAAKGRYLYLASLQTLCADWIGCRFGSCWPLKRAILYRALAPEKGRSMPGLKRDIDCLVARSKTALWEEPTSALPQGYSFIIGNVLLEYLKGLEFESRWVMIGQISNCFCSSSNVFFKVLPMKCRNQQTLSDLSKKMTEPKNQHCQDSIYFSFCHGLPVVYSGLLGKNITNKNCKVVPVLN
jgi:hypothetical protein